MILSNSFFKKRPRGFTLVEMLVSLGLFTSVVVIAVGAIFSAQTINTKLEQNQIILDGVNLALEMIARDVRYGSVFYCASVLPSSLYVDRQDCPQISTSGGSVIIFKPVVKLPGSTNYNLDRVAYFVLNGVIYRNEYKEGNVNNKITYQITPPDVNIKSLNFFITGAGSFQGGSPDFNQPLITIIVSGVTIPRKETIVPTNFDLQTSISSRRFDN